MISYWRWSCSWTSSVLFSQMVLLNSEKWYLPKIYKRTRREVLETWIFKEHQQLQQTRKAEGWWCWGRNRWHKLLYQVYASEILFSEVLFQILLHIHNSASWEFCGRLEDKEVGAGSIRLSVFWKKQRTPLRRTTQGMSVCLKIHCIVLLVGSDAQHRLGEDPTLVKGLCKVREASPGHLHGFNAAVLVVGQKFLSCHSKDCLETVRGLEVVLKALPRGRSDCKQHVWLSRAPREHPRALLPRLPSPLLRGTVHVWALFSGNVSSWQRAGRSLCSTKSLDDLWVVLQPLPHCQLPVLFSQRFHGVAARALAGDGGEHPVPVQGGAALQRHLLQQLWDFLRRHLGRWQHRFCAWCSLAAHYFPSRGCWWGRWHMAQTGFHALRMAQAWPPSLGRFGPGDLHGDGAGPWQSGCARREAELSCSWVQESHSGHCTCGLGAEGKVTATVRPAEFNLPAVLRVRSWQNKSGVSVGRQQPCSAVRAESQRGKMLP